MAVMAGKLGRIEWDCDAVRTQLTYAQSWTLDVGKDVEDVTSMGDTWRTYVSGFRNWTATVDCLYDSAGSDISIDPGDPNGFADVKAYLELFCVYDTGTPAYKFFYGYAICTGIATTHPAQGVSLVTYTFQGVSQMTWESGAVLHVY